MVLVDPFQLRIFSDSAFVKYIWYSPSLPQCFVWSSPHWLFVWFNCLPCIFLGLEPLPCCTSYCVWYVPHHFFPATKIFKNTHHITTVLFCLNGKQSLHLESVVSPKMYFKFLRKYCRNLSRCKLYLVDHWISNTPPPVPLFFSVEYKSLVNSQKLFKSLSTWQSFAELEVQILSSIQNILFCSIDMVNCAAQGTHTFKLLSTRVYVFIMIFTPPPYSKAINLNTSGWIPSSGIFTGSSKMWTKILH